MKKVWKVAAIALCFIIVSIVVLFVIQIISIWYTDVLKQDNESISNPLFRNSELLLMCLDLIATALLSYLVYRVNRQLTELSVRERESKVRESAYQIYYGLTYIITSLIRQKRSGTYRIKFKMRSDYINHIANISNRLPTDLIHALYDVFFDIAYISEAIEADEKDLIDCSDETAELVDRLFDTIFNEIYISYLNQTYSHETKQGPMPTNLNYQKFFNKDLELIFNEITEIIDIAN